MAKKAELKAVEETQAPNPTSEATMSKEDLKKQIADLKAREKALKEEAKVIREQEKAAKAAAKAAGAVPGYSRVDATTDFLKSLEGPASMEEIVKGANQIYKDRKASEKSDNERESRAVTTKVVNALANIGFLSVADGKYVRA